MALDAAGSRRGGEISFDPSWMACSFLVLIYSICGSDARGLDGHDRRAVHVRNQGRGGDSRRLRLEEQPSPDR